MDEEQRKISIRVRELFYSREGSNFFRDKDPEFQSFCLLVEKGDLLSAGRIWNFYTNEVSKRRSVYRELEFHRIYDKTLTRDLIDKIEKEEDFIFVHMVRGLDDSSIPGEILEKIYRINLKGFKIEPEITPASYKRPRLGLS